MALLKSVDMRGVWPLVHLRGIEQSLLYASATRGGQVVKRSQVAAEGAVRKRRSIRAMTEEMRPESPFGLQGAHENIWHIARAERWSDGQSIGHRTFCGRNYPTSVDRRDLDGLDQVCSDCTAQVSSSH